MISRRALRLVGWNALGLASGLAVVGALGEVGLRAAVPFMVPVNPRAFHPRVGFTRPPHAEIRSTNGLDYWQVSRANGLGFLDREPPSPERAAASCHLTILGDSLVEARQVPLADKTHFRLEELAAAELPDLDLTTSAFGLGDTGQVQQLAFYDEYARSLSPKVIVLVFVPNDLWDNSALFRAEKYGWDPERAPEPHAARGPDGAFTLRPPREDRAAGAFAPRPASGARRWIGSSWFARYLHAKRWVFREDGFRNPAGVPLLESLRRRPEYAGPGRGRPSRKPGETRRGEFEPILADALDSTAFALREFRRRADEIGAALVGLASHAFERAEARPGHRESRNPEDDAARPGIEEATPWSLRLDRLRALASAAGIPVLDLVGEIRRRGGTIGEVHFRHDRHWNPAGHRLAAEMLLAWLEDNREVCEGAPRLPAPEGVRPSASGS